MPPSLQQQGLVSCQLTVKIVETVGFLVLLVCAEKSRRLGLAVYLLTSMCLVKLLMSGLDVG